MSEKASHPPTEVSKRFPVSRQAAKPETSSTTVPQEAKSLPTGEEIEIQIWEASTTDPREAKSRTFPQTSSSPNGRVLITGTHSGAGKTTVTVAVIAALRARGLPVAGFKCGPDYIDPMFHREALGVPSRNLDPFFSTPSELRETVEQFRADNVCVIEGVMGFYDGLGTTTDCSTYSVAMATDTPAILVVNPRGCAASLGAVLAGFRDFRQPNTLQGVICNQTTESGYLQYRKLIEDAGLIPLGYLPKTTAVHWPSRHLGLMTAAEIPNLATAIADLGAQAEATIDIDTLLMLAGNPPVSRPNPTTRSGPTGVTIAVARDEAFCFCYEETLECLETFGVSPVFFSPIHDAVLPPSQGLYLPGGYPELHASALGANTTMLESIRTAIRSGLPTIAECGGFMYLHRKLDDVALVGVIDAAVHRTDRLQRFGYTTLTATADSLLGPVGTSLRTHEFHYYESDNSGCDFTAVKASSGATYRCGVATPSMYAGFPHLYLAAAPQVAQRFVNAARRYES
jgi:cobyrinic acid a,c-diamide synthase